MPLAASAFLSPLLTAPVALLGGGVSGEGAQALLAALGTTSVVYDAKGTEFTAAAALRHRLAVFSPGFPPEHPWLAIARASGCECLAELDLAALQWRGRIVAVTGTNGKTTLTEFLAHALRHHGVLAAATGNIGFPFSRLAAEASGLDSDRVAVCEVSSFQAEVLRHFRPEATLWTNFAEDHLERHGTLAAYFAAKAALGRASGRLFAGSSVRRYAEQHAVSDLGRCEWVKTEGQDSDPALADTVFAEYPQRENFLLAAAWWRAQGRPADALRAAARSFRLGRHRLARVAVSGGVTYWNDSKATNFHAVEAAVARFAEPVLLLAGGKGKGGDIGAFVARIAPRVRRAYLIGETRHALARACAAAGVAHTVCGSLAEAVRAAATAAGPGDHILLSPAFASFDLFRNYEDRGDQFEQLVRDVLSPPSRSAALPPVVS
jgi:UDP-N-acetylmuramoylalanine--D-glutamate ligase